MKPVTPFCWQWKPARRRIRQALDGANTVASGLAVYDALTEIASDKGQLSFETTHSFISLLSGVKVSCVKSRLADLAELGLVKVSTPKLRAPSTYTLLFDSQPTANDSQLSACVSQRTEIRPLATLEDTVLKNPKKKGEEKHSSPNGELLLITRSASRNGTSDYWLQVRRGSMTGELRIPESLATQEFVDLWCEWLEHSCGSLRKKECLKVWQRQLDRFEEDYDAVLACEQLTTSLTNGYKGLFQ
jgi:hypothetical protein